MEKPINVDDNISGFPVETQKLFEQMRTTIKKAAPKAEEVISYGMLVYFTGYKNHIGFYPASSGIANFKKELSIYKGAKGSVQFPLDKPLPLALIIKIVKFRLAENLLKAKTGKQ